MEITSLYDILTDDTALNTVCPLSFPFQATTNLSSNNHTVELHVDHVILVEKLHIIIGECPERDLAETELLVEYVFADDIAEQIKMALQVV